MDDPLTLMLGGNRGGLTSPDLRRLGGEPSLPSSIYLNCGLILCLGDPVVAGLLMSKLLT